MFKNIGTKIKTMAKLLTAFGIAGSVIVGIVVIAFDVDLALIGLGIMVVGSLVSWLGNWVLYAIGDTNEKINELYYDHFKNHGNQFGEKSTTKRYVDYKKETNEPKSSQDEKKEEDFYLIPGEVEDLTQRGKVKTKWMCPECARYNNLDEAICKCGYKRDEKL